MPRSVLPLSCQDRPGIAASDAGQETRRVTRAMRADDLVATGCDIESRMLVPDGDAAMREAGEGGRLEDDRVLLMRPDRARTGESGFTLIEMIVVVAVLALAAGLVLSRGPMHSATLDLRAAARTMAAEMRSTRAHAISTDHALLFTLDAAHGDYGVEKGPRHALPRGIVAVARGTAPVEQVLFRADGSASGGVLVLAEGARRIEVATDWLTGAVTVR